MDRKSNRFFKELNAQRGFACLLLLLSISGCKKAEQAEAIQKPVQRNISIKVAIIYNFGGAQAVARQDFYLLSKDAVQIWKEAGLMNDKKLGGRTFTGEKLFSIYFLEDRMSVLEKKEPSKFGEAIRPYTLKTVTTDFEGNATFESVPEGNYYIYGVTETRSGYSIWSYKVSTNESKPILLDNKNAVFSW